MTSVFLLGISLWREDRENPGLADYMGEKGD